MGTRSVNDFLPLKPAHFHILLAMSDGPIHGYGIRRDVEQRTDGRIVLAAGTLYETLQRLERRGLIEEAAPPADASDVANSRWRFFRTTPLGGRVVAGELVRLEADVAAARMRLRHGG